MSKILACAHCAVALPVGAKFCIACGQPVVAHCGACGTDTPFAAMFCPACGAGLGRPAADIHAERRQVTVMFCDLVGSTAITVSLDPEETSAIYQSYEQACLDVMSAHGGIIDRYEGDGAVALFGYPNAREDAAESAIRAGLDVAAAVARLQNPHGLALKVRIGIATGLVVVRNVAGGRTSGHRQIAGEAVNLAARLQAVAEPGMVVVSASTRQLVGDLFQLRDMGQHLLKGFAEPVGCWAVEQVAVPRSRFVAMRHRRQHIELIGRARDAQALLGWQKAAWAGRGQAVLISGEAGIGKSHLTAWLSGQLGQPGAQGVRGEPGYVRLQYQCSRHHQGSALFPFTVQLSHAARLAPDDVPASRLDKLERLLGLATDAPLAVAPLFAALLSIPAADRYPAFTINSDVQRRQTLDALLAQLVGLASRKPVLFIFEDLHWADATSLELLDAVLAQIEALPVLAVLTCRPDFEPTWRLRPHVHTMPLSRLDAPSAQAIVERLVEPGLLSGQAVQAIIERSDGVPLYIEELTRSVVDARHMDDARPRAGAEGGITAAVQASSIPASLRDSLVERLDRLAPVREVAQIGAAIGRDFSYALLRQVSGRDEVVLNDALARLEQADIVVPCEGRATRSYQFRHALVQEAAYDTLLKARRPPIHLRIAETLEQAFPDIAANEPEVLAHHYADAGQAEQAVKWWQLAGERAVKRSAYTEAALHMSRALATAEAMPPGPGLGLLQLRLHVAYGQVMLAARGYAAPETTAAFRRARQLAMDIEDVSQRFAVYYGLWAGSHIRSELAPMREMVDAFLHETQDRPGTPEDCIAQRLAGTTLAFEGQFVAARQHLERALAIYDPARDAPLAYRFGHDVGVAAQCYLVMTLWPLGEVELAQTLSDAALDNARQSGHAPTMAYSHAYRCMFEATRHNAPAAVAHAEALMALSREHGMHWWLASATFFRGWSRWHIGHRDEGSADMHRGMALCREHGLSSPVQFGAMVAETEAASGQVEQALARMDQVVATIQRTGECWFESEAHCVRAAILAQLHPDDPTLAAAGYQHALDVAQRQQARSLALRAALGLARLHGAVLPLDSSTLQILTQASQAFAPGSPLPELVQAHALMAGA